MILVVGGIASGKRSYLRSLGFCDVQMSTSVWDETPVLLGLEELLRDGPLGDAALAAIQRKQAVCCLEVGLGVVPVDAAERAWRERVGRACAQLAEGADSVVRMVCGIPVTIRGPVG